MVGTEKVLEAPVKDRLKVNLTTLEAYFFMPVQMGIGAVTVDCLACIPYAIRRDDVGKQVGLFAAIECKRPSISRPSARQELTLQQVRSAGGLIALVNNHKMAASELLQTLLYSRETA